MKENNLTQDEVIEKLQNYGINVKMKPVALMPINISEFMFMNGFRQEHFIEEMDIYKALRVLECKSEILKKIDPFS